MKLRVGTQDKKNGTGTRHYVHFFTTKYSKGGSKITIKKVSSNTTCLVTIFQRPGHARDTAVTFFRKVSGTILKKNATGTCKIIIGIYDRSIGIWSSNPQLFCNLSKVAGLF